MLTATTPAATVHVDPRIATCGTCRKVTICHRHITPDGESEWMCGLDLIVWANEVERAGTRLAFRVEQVA